MKNPISTISGVLMLVIPLLVIVGVIDAGDQADVEGYVNEIIDAVVALIGGVSGIIAIFSGDPGSKESGV